MKANDYWQMFMETGVPEYYLLYNHAQKLENHNVLDHTGSGAAGNHLQ